MPPEKVPGLRFSYADTGVETQRKRRAKEESEGKGRRKELLVLQMGVLCVVTFVETVNWAIRKETQKKTCGRGRGHRMKVNS